MVEIIGNNIAQILAERSAAAKDPEAFRKEKLELLEEGGKKNRFTGLLKGTYQISLREAIEVKEIFDLESIDEVVVYRKVEKTKTE